MLEERDGSAGAEEEFALLEDSPSEADGPRGAGLAPVKGAKALRGAELAVFVSLEWRDGAARRRGSGHLPDPQQRADARDGEEPADRAGRPEGDSRA